MAFTLSSIIIGDKLELRCCRRVLRPTTIAVPADESPGQRLLRRLLRGPQPMKTIPWQDLSFEDVGPPLVLMGTEEGVVVLEVEPRP